MTDEQFMLFMKGLDSLITSHADMAESAREISDSLTVLVAALHRVVDNEEKA